MRVFSLTVSTAGVVKKAKDLGMTADPGPVIEGYVECNFNDELPNGEEADVYIAELEHDLSKEEE